MDDNFSAALHSWIMSVQNLIDEQYQTSYAKLTIPKLKYSEGKRYVKIIKHDKNNESVFAFIDLKNGDVLKPASWNAPAKHARGNLFDEHGGTGEVTWLGPNYLRPNHLR